MGAGVGGTSAATSGMSMVSNVLCFRRISLFVPLSLSLITWYHLVTIFPISLLL